jgi:hypothetical protein
MFSRRALGATFLLAGCAGPAVVKGTEEQSAARPQPEVSYDGGALSAADANEQKVDPVANAAADAAVGTAAARSPADGGPALTVIELCKTMCERMKAKGCADTAIQFCRMNCDRYRPPASCDAEVRSALECARDAPDLQCAYIVPGSCNAKFRRMTACAHGEKYELPAEKPEMPDGWERYRTKTGGFSVPMPRNVVEKTTGDRPTYSAAQDPASYTVEVYPPLPEPPTDKNLLKLAVRILGQECSGRKLKIHGMVEQNGQVSVRYDTECRGTERHGLFHMTPARMYVLTVTGPKGVKAERDTFLYGFSPE